MTDYIVMFDEPLSEADFQRVTAEFPEGAMQPIATSAAKNVMNSVYFSKESLHQYGRCAYLVTDPMLATTLKFSSDPRAILEFEPDLIQRCADWNTVISRVMSLGNAAEELETELDAHRKWMRRETPALSKAQDAILPQNLSQQLGEDFSEIRGVIKTYLDAHP
jgi:hypothetical protein